MGQSRASKNLLLYGHPAGAAIGKVVRKVIKKVLPMKSPTGTYVSETKRMLKQLQ